MPARRPLVNPFGQRPHLRHPVAIFCPSSIPPPPGFAPCPSTTSIASAFRRSSGFIPYRDGNTWYTSVFDCAPLLLDIPPSPVVVLVPTALAPRPSAPLARAESDPKLIPAIVTGIFKCTGFFAYRVPSITSVAHRSRYPSSGYRDMLAPRNTRSSKFGNFRFAPKPRIS